MSFFRGFFGAMGVVFGFAFALWVLKITFIPHAQVHWGPEVKSETRTCTTTRKKWRSASTPFNWNVQEFKDGSPKVSSGALRKRRNWRFDAKAFDTLAVNMVNGRCAIAGDDDVEYIAVMASVETSSEDHSSTQNLIDQTRVVAAKDTKNNVITLSLEQPRSKPNALINWIILFPNNMALKIEAANGHVVMLNMKSSVDIRVQNGQIDVKTPHVRKPVSYQTKNGKINLELGQLEEDAFVSAQTENGAIFVTVPSDSAYNIVTKVNLGAVMSSYPTSNTVDENTQIALETNNGMIYIK